MTNIIVGPVVMIHQNLVGCPPLSFLHCLSHILKLRRGLVSGLFLRAELLSVAQPFLLVDCTESSGY